MLIQLLETGHAPQRRAAGAMTSVMVHGALITLAIQLTTTAVREVDRVRAEHLVMAGVSEPAKPESEEPPPARTEVVVVQPRLMPAKGFQVLTAPIHVPTALPDIDLSKGVTDEADFSGRGVAGGFARGVIGGVVTDVPPRLENGGAYLITEVERIAEPYPGNPVPRYPDSFRAAGIEGSVTLLFVIDTTGRADLSSIRVRHTDSDLFTASAREALERSRFRPAEIGGRKVRMLVEQPFVFALDR
jgi:periplasmic protein TonB